MTTGNPSPCQVVLPIRVGLDPMEGLLVATFKGDPEFEGIEPARLVITERGVDLHRCAGTQGRVPRPRGHSR